MHDYLVLSLLYITFVTIIFQLYSKFEHLNEDLLNEYSLKMKSNMINMTILKLK